MIKTDSVTYETRGLSIWNGGLSEYKTVVGGLLQKRLYISRKLTHNYATW